MKTIIYILLALLLYSCGGGSSGGSSSDNISSISEIEASNFHQSVREFTSEYYELLYTEGWFEACKHQMTYMLYQGEYPDDDTGIINECSHIADDRYSDYGDYVQHVELQYIEEPSSNPAKYYWVQIIFETEYTECTEEETFMFTRDITNPAYFNYTGHMFSECK